MKKLLFLFLSLLFSVSVIGQQASSCKKTCCSSKKPTVATLDKNLQIVFVVDSVQHKVADINAYDFSPEWVESISIAKDKTSREVWGNDHGVAFLYIKEEYNKKVLRQVNKHKREG